MLYTENTTYFMVSFILSSRMNKSDLWLQKTFWDDGNGT